MASAPSQPCSAEERAAGRRRTPRRGSHAIAERRQTRARERERVGIASSRGGVCRAPRRAARPRGRRARSFHRRDGHPAGGAAPPPPAPPSPAHGLRPPARCPSRHLHRRPSSPRCPAALAALTPRLLASAYRRPVHLTPFRHAHRSSASKRPGSSKIFLLVGRERALPRVLVPHPELVDVAREHRSRLMRGILAEMLRHEDASLRVELTLVAPRRRSTSLKRCICRSKRLLREQPAPRALAMPPADRRRDTADPVCEIA